MGKKIIEKTVPAYPLSMDRLCQITHMYLELEVNSERQVGG